MFGHNVYHSNAKLTKTETGTKICCDRPDHVLLARVVEGMRNFRLENPLNVSSLMNCCENLGNNESSTDNGGLAYEVSEESSSVL